jgi:circadian clock protein KaiB
MDELNGSTKFKKVLKDRRMENYVLHLYVKDMSLKSVQAIENIEHICEENLQGHYQLDVIDICEQPILARESQIIATPTLIKESPLPLRRLVGNMSNTERVLVGLGL